VSAVPDIVGYDQLVPVGRGGVGDVYRATRTATGATVAIKILRDVTDESAAWRRCRRELTALLALGGHPHVVALVDVVTAGACAALVMEFAPGGSVAALAERRGEALAVGEAVRVGAHAAAALAGAHARGIVHRDVKPHNLLIDAAGTVKLCDFGIAAVARSPEFRHATATVSLRFASPEDLEDDAEVGPPADVYSLGATLLYLARGEHLELRDRLTAWQPPPAEGEPVDGAATLDALIAECLQPDPAARPTADDLYRRLAALDAAVGQAIVEPEASGVLPLPSETLPRPVPGHVPPAPQVPPRPSPAHPRPHRRRALVAGAVTGLLLVTFAGWWAWALRDDGHAPAPSGPRLVARPSGLVELTSLTWPVGAAGMCLRQEPGKAALEPVECTESHDLERVGGGRLPDESAEFVTADVDATVDAACATAARRFAGADPAGLGLTIAVTRPSADGWAAGDRTFQCFVGAPDRRVTGTVAAVVVVVETKAG